MLFKAALEEYLNTIEEEDLRNKCRYALDSNGKYVRPILFYFTLKKYDLPVKKYINYALAIEMVHTYSLIHDDLPCMDNDDFRRNKLSLHLKYNEEIAVLIGDMFLSDAFSLLSSQKDIEGIAASLLSQCIGSKGMVLGQYYDLKYLKNSPSMVNILKMYSLKTGKLFEYCLCLPALIAHRDEDVKLLKELASNLGILYQIKDDIKDYHVQKESFLNWKIDVSFLNKIYEEYVLKVENLFNLLKISKQDELYQYLKNMF